VQSSGPWNALGKIKFVIETEYDIYLHDTPDKLVFNKRNRTLSHGCIRLEKPMELANYLLKNDNSSWATKLDSGILSKVYLERAMPVYVVYYSAWVDKSGVLNIKKDIYNKDEIEILN
jgi:murein L,D-transpeptidase YcbB/YkuD